MAKDRPHAARLERNCPMPSAHTRLRQAHDMWHSALAAYADADQFVLHLNQLIVTLRQATFMVQNYKSAISDFDEWYGGWQDRMKADRIMKWMHDARTHIEHRGDLDVASTARVSVVVDWLNEPYKTFEAPPLLSPEAIALTQDLEGLPERIRSEGLIKVERRWVSRDLPEHELLAVCAHSYGVCASIVAEGHLRLGQRMQTFGGETHGGRHERTEHLGGRLSCMVASSDARTAWIHIASGSLMETEVRTRTLDLERDAPAIIERLERMSISPGALQARVTDALDIGSGIFSIAKRTLVHDGYHRPIAFLYDGDHRPMDIIGLNFDDQASKYHQMRSVADNVARLGASTVVMVSETWTAHVPIAEMTADMVRPEHRPDREEHLVVQVATADGRVRSYSARFHRDSDGRPVFRATDCVEEGRALALNSFEPILRVWRERKANASD